MRTKTKQKRIIAISVAIAFAMAVVLMALSGLFAPVQRAEAAGNEGGKLVADKTVLKAGKTGQTVQLKPYMTLDSSKKYQAFSFDIVYDTTMFTYNVGTGYVASTDMPSGTMMQDSNVSAGKLGVSWAKSYKGAVVQGVTEFSLGTFTLQVKDGLSVGETSTAGSLSNLGAQMQQDGSGTSSYFGAVSPITFTVQAPSNDTTLNSLTGAGITWNGTSAEVLYSTSSVTLTANVAAGATAKINGGGATQAVSLTAGSATTVTVVVTAEDGTTTKTYTYTITRKSGAVGADATVTLKNNGAVISNGATIPYADRAKVTLTATNVSTNATLSLKVNNAAVNIQKDQQVNLPSLNEGANTIALTVTPETGAANTQTFTLTVVKGDTNVELNTLKLTYGADTAVAISPAFAPNVRTYSASVPEGTTQINVAATTASASATITGLGIKTVPGTITVTVTPENAAAAVTYTIVVAWVTDVNTLKLSDITVTDADNAAATFSLSPDFDSENLFYTVNIPYTTRLVNGNVRVTAIAIGSVPMEGGNNQIAMKRGQSVTHRIQLGERLTDGSFKALKEYTLQIIYESNDLNIGSIVIGNTSSPDDFTFDKNVLNYELRLSKMTSRLDLQITTSNEYKVYGNENLVAGRNMVIIEFKASSGKTTLYRIDVYNPSQSNVAGIILSAVFGAIAVAGVVVAIVLGVRYKKMKAAAKGDGGVRELPRRKVVGIDRNTAMKDDSNAHLDII